MAKVRNGHKLATVIAVDERKLELLDWSFLIYWTLGSQFKSREKVLIINQRSARKGAIRGQAIGRHHWGCR